MGISDHGTTYSGGGGDHEKVGEEEEEDEDDQPTGMSTPLEVDDGHVRGGT